MEERRGTGIKGATLKHNLLAIQNLYGAEALAKIKAGVSPSVRERMEHVTPLDMIPPEVFGEIHETMKQVLGTTGWDASHAVGSEAARLEFGGIYRVLLRAVQYDTVWDRIERTWNHIVGRGAFRWIERGDDFVKGEVVGVVNFHPGIWHSSAGRAERLLVMSGAKSAHVTMIETSPTRGSFEAYWVP
ncbi:MAG: hypothetical protein ACXWUG_10370 [Polyangiales bacterium]